MALRVTIDRRPGPELPAPPPGYDSVEAMAAIGRRASPHLLEMQVGFAVDLFAQGDAERIIKHGGEWRNGAHVKAMTAMNVMRGLNPYLFAKRVELSGTVQTQSHDDRIAEIMRASAQVDKDQGR